MIGNNENDRLFDVITVATSIMQFEHATRMKWKKHSNFLWKIIHIFLPLAVGAAFLWQIATSLILLINILSLTYCAHRCAERSKFWDKKYNETKDKTDELIKLAKKHPNIKPYLKVYK